ncbi:WbqC family protein [Solibacillus sp. MA9]|uniref:WbqC family protein n=1 Tax=Solibacillus palustris TaxID=2908203 RepID=A0ABS9U9P5_9BACL|nr:WbqC family protein [Solibacillus sp. MA9]MCH7321032.1 WbqC family protein [Solibacillus sp. MA9]
MKLVLMQPYFFPYIGYFQLMNLCDEFIVFDTVQYIKKGWINRNRILHPEGTPTYINVPIQKFKSNTLIKDILINNKENWKQSIINRLQQYYKNAPYTEEVIAFVENCLSEEFSNLSELNVRLLKETCNYLNISCRITSLSKSNFEYEDATAPDEWGLNICKALDAKTYINAPGGILFFDIDKYKEESIEIKFINPILNNYVQNYETFVPGLSILDVMMFNSVDEIQEMLLSYEEI